MGRFLGLRELQAYGDQDGAITRQQGPGDPGQVVWGKTGSGVGGHLLRVGTLGSPREESFSRAG